MIPVLPQPEPSYFDAEVRKPGQKALAEYHAGTRKTLPNLWAGKCLSDMFRAYDQTCAYVGIRIAKTVGSETVEHFAPKNKHPGFRYEWSNYRLVCSKMNSRKNEFEDVLDPFEVSPNWFILNLRTLKVTPNPKCPPIIRERIQQTISRLRLNDKDVVDARTEYYEEFRLGHVDFAFLQRWSPFVAYEMCRQGLAPHNGVR